jgi:hypothetical protein
MTATEISNSEDLIDVRNVIARIEELEEAQAGLYIEEDEFEELNTLSELMIGMRGYGGDEQWRGDWYPGSLIRDSYFEDYARELADDIGIVTNGQGWPNSYIDWEAAAAALQMDYTPVEYDGVTYWYG